MGIGIWELLLLFLIVVVLFGTKKLRTVGADLGAAIKSFRGALRESGEEHPEPSGEDKVLEEKPG